MASFAFIAAAFALAPFAIIEPICRITSYNVCYTKLLRNKRGELDDIPELCTFAKKLERVITSYSIHYTKLYDGVSISPWGVIKVPRLAMDLLSFFINLYSNIMSYMLLENIQLCCRIFVLFN